MKSNDFPLPHDGISKKHSLKQALLIIYTLEERILAAATFKGFWVLSLQSKKNVLYILIYLSLLYISRGKKTK